MQNSFFVAWYSDSKPETAVLATGCKSVEEAARWALENDLPRWATDDTRLAVYQGNPKDGRLTLFTVRHIRQNGRFVE